MQPVAINGKSTERKSGENKPNPLRPVATGCLRRSDGKEGVDRPVRAPAGPVGGRALETPWKPNDAPPNVLAGPPARQTGGRPGNVMETTGCNQAKNAGLPNLPKTA